MIRQAHPQDLPRLRTIQTLSLEEPWHGLLKPAVKITGPPLVFVTTCEKSEIESEPVGYAVVIPDDDTDTAYLAEIAVAPVHRSEGHGSRLVTRICDQLGADGYEQLRLTVQIDNDRARAFYDRHCFRTQSLLPEHYENDDGLLLVRSLSDQPTNE